MSGIYTVARQAFATAALNWTSASFKAILLSSAYTPDYAAHTKLSDVPGGSRLAAAVALANTTVVNGVCSADSLLWTNLLVTDHIAAVLIVRDNGGAEGNFPLIALIDQGIGFGGSPAHEDTRLFWNSTSGIFSL